MVALKQQDSDKLQLQLHDWLAYLRPLPIAPLPIVEFDLMVAQLEQGVSERQWARVNEAILLAEVIVDLGRIFRHVPYRALGKMLLGDSLAIQGKSHGRAWQLIEEAGALFRDEGDSLGWARSRTGLLGICIEMGKVEETLKEARQAEEIFRQVGQEVYLIRQKVNWLKALNHTGRYQQTINEFTEARQMIAAHRKELPYQVAALYNNVGNAYWYLGDIPAALRWFNLTEQELLAGGFLEASKIAALNIIGANRALGRYDQALGLLHELLQRYDSQQNIYALRARIEIIECYLALNRFTEARAESENLERDFGQLAEPLLSDKAQLYRHKAAALQKSGLLEEARRSLSQARGYFAHIDAAAWLAYCDSQLGWIALQQHEPQEAQRLAEAARRYFAEQGQWANLTSTLLLLAECQVQLGDLATALSLARQALAQTRAVHLPEQRYQAHLLCGRFLRQMGELTSSQRHYQACLRIIKYLRQSLTITLRSDYLSDKDEALQALVLTYLHQGKSAKAMFCLEESRALTTADYMANRDRLVWRQDDPISQQLQADLRALREKHGFLYQQAHERSYLRQDQIALDDSGAQSQLIQIEAEIRRVVEALYLRAAQENNYAMTTLPDLPTLQQRLAQDEGAIAYYLGQESWLFWITKDEISSHRLPVNGHRLGREVDRLRFTLMCALQKAADPATVAQLKLVTDRVATNLFAMLLEPIWTAMREKVRLFLIPHGPLHSLPFNLLRSSAGYLVETHELVTLPSFSLLKQPYYGLDGESLILTDDYRGRLPLTRAEGDMVAHMLAAPARHNDQATIAEVRPGAILHVAAHGEHRPDHPELSYIQLAGKQYFTDDLLQTDLRYELVTLSGCETGIVAWNSSETLVGLTQGVLCAGAGALLASYWRVEDSLALSWMQQFYQELCAGQSKSAALRTAQLRFLQTDVKNHPAYWGAFQLIGQPGPILSFEAKRRTHA